MRPLYPPSQFTVVLGGTRTHAAMRIQSSHQSGLRLIVLQYTLSPRKKVARLVNAHPLEMSAGPRSSCGRVASSAGLYRNGGMGEAIVV